MGQGLFGRTKVGTRAGRIIAALLFTMASGAVGIIPFGDAASDRVWSVRVFGNAARAADARPSTAVGALGRVEPESEIVNVNAAAPDRLDSLLVHRGDPVSRGQIIGYLDGYAEQEAQEKLVAAQLEEAQAQLATQTELDNRRIEDAEERLKRTADVTPVQIAAQNATIEALEAVLANDTDILTSYNELMRTDAGSRRTRDNQRAVVLRGDANLRAARAQLKVLEEQFAVDQQMADNQVRLAKAAMENTRTSVPIKSLTARLAVAHAQLRRMTIIAPIDGRVLNIQAHPGEQVGQPGDKPILSIGGTERMRVVAEVYETDVVRIRIGDKATVTSRALSGPLTGVVVEIGSMIFKNDVLNLDPAARADARVVEVRIALDDAEPVARLTNLSVDVVIDTRDRQAAAASPSAAK
jgi:HlyD family secretion protein